MFDPYHRWLGIPRRQRPPTYYQLLGIAPDEDDREVIEEAALRQTSHVRTYQTGPYAQQCTALLNEIAQARATLVNPARRKEYDARLAPPATSKTEDRGSRIEDRKSAILDPRSSILNPQSGLPAWADPVGLAYVLLLLLGGALAFWLSYSR